MGCRPRKTASFAVALVSALLAGVTVVPRAVALQEPDDRWLRVETDSFFLFGDIGEARARTLAVQIERLRSVLEIVAPALRLESGRPVYIYAFAEDRSFRKYARKQGVSGTVAGLSFAAPDGSYIMVNAGGEAYSFGVVYHEYLHHAMEDTYSELPLWLNEGMAEFFSTFWTNGYQAEIGAPIAEHLDLLATARLLPLERLFAVTPQSAEYSNLEVKRVFHAESWLLIHYLVQGRPELRPAIPRYVRAVQEGPLDPEAFEGVFGMGVRELEGELLTYLRRGVLPNSTIDFVEPLPDTAITLQAMSEADVHHRLGQLLLARGGPEGTGMADRHLSKALALEPDHAAALSAMAELRTRQGKEREAAVYGYLAAASSYIDAGQVERGLASLRQALAATGDASLRRRLEERIRRIDERR